MKLNQILLLPLFAFLSLNLVGQDKFAGNYTLLLRSGNFQPTANLDQVTGNPEFFVSPSAIRLGYSFQYFQFNAIPTAAERKSLEALGLTFLEYIPHKTYLVAVPLGFDPTQLSGHNVRSVFDLPETAKTSPTFEERPFPEHAYDGKQVKLSVLYQEVLAVSRVKEMLIQDFGVGIRFDYEAAQASLLEFWIDENRVNEVASEAYIRYAEIAAEPGEAESTLGRSQHRGNVMDANYPLGRHFDGTGVSVAINDDGSVGPHIDFTGRADQTDVVGFNDGTHGDMTVGIVGGAGNVDPTVKGMATGSFLHVRRYVASLPNTLNLFANDDVVIFSSSYSNGCNAGYTTTTRNVDQQIYDNTAILQVFSAGNSNNNDCGYGAGSTWGNITGGHKIAKNVIATANLFDNEDLVNSSSRGPASDGRIKPDISAHGQGQMSTDPNNTYAPGGGTSAAAPGIAGIMAQLYHAYRDMNGGNNPESGLMKACMLNSAEDLGTPGPDFNYGWGRVNGFRALTTLEDNRYINASIGQGGANTHTINVPAGTQEVRVMLYWMDPEASTAAQYALVNDLDLTLEDPSTNINLPWFPDHTPDVSTLALPAAPGVDSLNNVEQVVISNPAAGAYTIHVSGAAVPQGPQSYYIVYEFHTSAVDITYPIGGEGFVPGTSERLRWDANGNTGFFNLEISTDGGNAWSPLVSSINGALRELNWTVPNTVTGQARVRITRGSDTDMSDADFTIIGQPQNLNVDWTCPDSILFSWSAVNGATEYEVSLLGAKYMDALNTTTETFMVIPGLDPTHEDWLSVKALGPNGIVGRRAIAIPKPTGVNNCTLPTDADLVNVLSPAMGTVPGCFDYSALVVKVTIANSGSADISNVPIGYTINGAPAVTETYTGTIAAGQSVEYEFTAVEDLSAPALYDVKAWTALPGDGNTYNDSIGYQMEKSISLVTVTTPYAQDFETFNLCAPQSNCEAINCNFPNESGWENEANNSVDNIDWRTDNNGTPSDETGPTVDHNPGSTFGKYVYLEPSGECNFKEALMLTPCIDLTDAMWPEFGFWYHMYGVEMGNLHVDILSKDGYVLDVIPPIEGNMANVWREKKFSLSDYKGEIIVVRFRGITGPDFRSDMAIDDISVTDPFDTGEEELLSNNGSFALYPNPTTNNTLLRFDLKGESGQVEVLNALSQQVGLFTLSQGAKSLEIPSQSYPQGVYFVVARNNSGEVLTVKKLVKE